MENLGNKALAVVLLVIIICVGAVILDNLQSNIRTTDGTTTLNVLNETGSVNDIGYQLKGTSGSLDNLGWTIVAIQNVSAGQQGAYLTGGTANYTLNSSGWIINGTSNPQGFYRANITYTHTATQQTAQYNITVLGLGGMTTFGNWINIIVIMIIVGAIIALIYGVFRFVGGGTAGGTAY